MFLLGMIYLLMLAIKPRLLVVELLVLCCALLIVAIPVYLRYKHPGYRQPLSVAWLAAMGMVLTAAFLDVMRRSWDLPRALGPYELDFGLMAAATLFYVASMVVMSAEIEKRRQASLLLDGAPSGN
jgi:hypothetical protein